MRELFGLVSRTSDPVPLEGVCVSGSILGRGARVKVAQRFRNAEARAIEAVYRFPLPESAAVCGFAALVAGRRISGTVEEREKAFEMYDDALARGDGAFLLDQERPNIFTLSVGSLPAGAEAVVEVEYVSLLDQRGGEVRFSLPTTISPRYLPADSPDEDGIPASERIHPEYATSVPYGLSVEIVVRDAAGVESVESPSHAINVSMGGEPSGTGDMGVAGDAILVRFAADAVTMDRDFVLSITHRGRSTGRAWQMSDERGSWMQLDLSPEELEETGARAGERGDAPGDVIPREVIFVLDCSGSMHGDSISQARRALEVCLRALEKGAFFNVVRFGATFESLFPRPREYGEQSLGEALGWLRAVDSDLGGTEVLAPLAHVYGTAARAGAARSVVLLTDGEVGNEAEVMSLVHTHAASTRFFCVGIGAGPNDHLVRGLARAGCGSAAFIYPGERIEPKVVGLFRQAVGPRVSDVKIEWGDAGARAEQAPAVPVLVPGEPMTAWARLPAGAEAAPGAGVTVSAMIEGRPARWTLPVVPAGTGQLPLTTLWARERIRQIEESQQAGGRGSRQKRPKSESWKQEVIALAREFGLSSSMTSWIAIEEREEKDKQTGEIVLRKVPTLVTVGWHGVGGVQGVGAPQFFGTSGRAAPTAFILRGALRVQGPDVRDGEILCGALPDDQSVFGAGAADMDRLMQLLPLQGADGGFDLTDEQMIAIGVDGTVISLAAAGIPGDRKTALRLLHTAFVLALLEARYADSRNTWFAAVRKSRTWLKKATAGLGAVIDGKTVTQWAKEVVAAAKPAET